MKFKLKVATEIDIKTLEISSKVKNWEDATVNSVIDKKGTLIPCRVGENWCPKINIETGQIKNWKQGTIATVKYEVFDWSEYWIVDAGSVRVAKAKNFWVPDFLDKDGNDRYNFIIMRIDKDGFIENFKFDISEFND